jgi:hypothetical protein
MPDESITAIARRALVETGKTSELAEYFKSKYGWRGSSRDAYQRTLRKLNSGYGDTVRHFPADDLVKVAELTGCEEFEDALRRARERGELLRLRKRLEKLEGRASNRKMVSVSRQCDEAHKGHG